MHRLQPIPVLDDNYVWALHDQDDALLVDPGDAGPILAWLAAGRIRPAALLLTHRHGDHVGGVPALRAAWPGLPVYGPAGLPGVNHPIGDGDRVVLSRPGATFTVLSVPGHTREHVAYFGEGLLFCGDTLFASGCGRAFDGRPDQLHDSLVRLAALPSETRVCCAHEYTLDNLRFARHLEPEHPELTDWQARCEAQRAIGQPTLPTTLAEERRRNPFLRCDEPALVERLAALAGTGPYPGSQAAWIAMRAYKDRFDAM
ncbi:MAG: hydroxyacylglutathione hydrolase [Pseudomonadota bacterium]